MDLQPNFQRGEVWSRGKKQRLIDSILRDWHVPPIHVIENIENKKQEVLDGQQRLTAIRDFVANRFPIEGKTDPYDERVAVLDGLYYRELDSEWRRLFNRFSIRCFLLVDYKPSEPGELFFRLNQPTNLTSAEQRNAFFGPVRVQIKELLDRLTAEGMNAEKLGFSNFRMAYDDVVARIALALVQGSLSEKITAKDLELLYRSEEGLPPRLIDLEYAALSQVIWAASHSTVSVRMNKASMFSWSMFIGRAYLHDFAAISGTSFLSFFIYFNQSREFYRSSTIPEVWPSLFRIYDSRSSSRVADASSVILRDAVLWMMFLDFSQKAGFVESPGSLGLFRIQEILANLGSRGGFTEETLSRELLECKWPILTK